MSAGSNLCSPSATGGAVTRINAREGCPNSPISRFNSAILPAWTISLPHRNIFKEVLCLFHSFISISGTNKACNDKFSNKACDVFFRCRVPTTRISQDGRTKYCLIPEINFAFFVFSLCEHLAELWETAALLQLHRFAFWQACQTVALWAHLQVSQRRG